MNKLVQYCVGNGEWPISVIDDFHEAPMSLVDGAGEFSSFESYKNDFYPGVKRPADNDQYAKNFARYTDVLSAIFGTIEDLQGSTYAVANNAPADLLPIQRIPHYDTPDSSQLALVHYLCAPEWGGTAFYRHRSTNIERVDSQSESAFQQALGREATTHGFPPADYLNGDTDLFEQIGIVDAKFNRAVIYPAGLLHSGAIQLHHPNNNHVGNCSLGAVRLTITAYLQSTPKP